MVINKEKLSTSKSGEKETHALTIRIPISHYNTLLKIQKYTGNSKNGVCLTALLKGMKQMLKEMDE